VKEVTSRTSSAKLRELSISAQVEWSDGRRPSLATDLNGVSFEDQVEIGLRAALFGEQLPERLGTLGSTIDTSDTLAPLDGLGLPQDSYEPIARLLIVERLIGGHGASRIEHFAVGPEHRGSRPVELAWREPLYYSGVEARRRQIVGDRRSRARLSA
jgi:hypothetical protein